MAELCGRENNSFYHIFVYFLLCCLLESGSCRLSSPSVQDARNLDETHVTKAIFPSINDTMLLSRISKQIYDFRDDLATCEAISPKLGCEFTCHLFERDEQDTEVVVVSHEKSKLLSVVFRGTVDLQNFVTDAKILTRPFCVPRDTSVANLSNSNDGKSHSRSSMSCDEFSENTVRVHEGFYNSVFSDGLYHRILKSVQDVKVKHPEYRVITTGHSMGAAASVLTAVALQTDTSFSSEEDITSINFGCPQIGNEEWYNWVNSLRPNLSIWRYVHQHDIVTRLPAIRFWHVGHTLQMDADMIRAYYLHYGSTQNAGVPHGWEVYSLISSPIGTYEHLMTHYVNYLEDEKNKDEDATHFVDKFEKTDHSLEVDSFNKNEFLDPSKATLKVTHLDFISTRKPFNNIFSNPECEEIANSHLNSIIDVDGWEYVLDRMLDCYKHIASIDR